MKRFFVINFEDGFDLTDDFARIKYVISKFSGVEIREIDEPWQAYCYACFHHTTKKIVTKSFCYAYTAKV